MRKQQRHLGPNFGELPWLEQLQDRQHQALASGGFGGHELGARLNRPPSRFEIRGGESLAERVFLTRRGIFSSLSSLLTDHQIVGEGPVHRLALGRRKLETLYDRLSIPPQIATHLRHIRRRLGAELLIAIFCGCRQHWRWRLRYSNRRQKRYAQPCRRNRRRPCRRNRQRKRFVRTHVSVPRSAVVT